MRGFGGIGGILRWKVDFLTMEDQQNTGVTIQTRNAREAAAADIRDTFGGDVGEDNNENDDDDDDYAPSKGYDDEIDFM